MDLSYKILWIDDDKSFIDASSSDIYNHIASNGFDPDIHPLYKNFEAETVSEASNPKYDLIISDWDLGLKTSQDFLKEIRNNNIYTEILFYSSVVDNLHEELYRNSISGVYHCNRKYVVEKAKEYISYFIKKYLDSDNLKGIILNEASKIEKYIKDKLLEHRMLECEISRCYVQNCNNTKTKLSDIVSCFNNSQLHPDWINYPKFSSADERIDLLNEIFSRNGNAYDINLINDIKKINKIRNETAHILTDDSSECIRSTYLGVDGFKYTGRLLIKTEKILGIL